MYVCMYIGDGSGVMVDILGNEHVLYHFITDLFLLNST